MANKEKQREKWNKALVELKLMDEQDEVEDWVQANWLEITLKVFGSWQKGNLIFTKERLIFTTAFAVSNFSIKYEDIREINKCSVGLFPMGMIVSVYDSESDSIKKYKCSLSKRNVWMEYLSKKAKLLS